ncbi:uncharacterized protein DNG_07616 [Cephalotrichum gorgonifer]|uniref:Uncharacterized protein n=1 Tax=Cephalotrichum gorgonifer TaxID=2041049 RepID=A0AAE8N1Z0_9PEZI|nr:uncharacterized protein DNG_07616 [Cephalotrichum gorgonifer]
MPKLIILAGAPEASALNWSLPLHDTLTHPLTSLLRSGSPTAPAPHDPHPPAPSLPPTVPAWRSIPLEKAPLRTGFTQYLPASDAPLFPSFLRPQFASSQDPSPYSLSGQAEVEDEDELSSFYEYSLAAHDSSSTSQLGPGTGLGLDGCDDTSFLSDYSVAPSLDPGIAAPPTDLSSLRPPPGIGGRDVRPDPSRPVTLLVGVISLEPRTLQTRFGEREVVEALVGDDTRSAFRLTFWLGAPGAVSRLALEVRALRLGDVVLVRGVAVGCFRGRVCGQSVAGGMGTRVFLLFGEGSDAEGGEPRGHYSREDMVTRREVHPQLGKTRRVRRWMRGVDAEAGGAPRAGEVVDNMPNDTLE